MLTCDLQTHTGSKRTFLALLRSMIKKDKMGVGLFLPRKTSPPVFVHILAQAEEREGGRQIKPPGFHLIQLPFADNLRPPGIDSTVSCVADPNCTWCCRVPFFFYLSERRSFSCSFCLAEEQPIIDEAKTIMNKVFFKGGYEPDRFPNPGLFLAFVARGASGVLRKDCW
jgi:ATP-dependent DNA helicase 2 subunit 1